MDQKKLDLLYLVVHAHRPLTKSIFIKIFTFSDKLAHLRDQVTEFNNFTLSVREGELNPQVYRNPFDIPRKQLIDQLTRMRANFLQVIF